MWRQMLTLVAEEGVLREAVLDDALEAVVRCEGVLALVVILCVIIPRAFSSFCVILPMAIAGLR